MSTLTAIGFTATVGAFGFVVSMVSFGFAASKQSTFIAARCSARPKNVIHNPNPNHACQDRGNVYWGWIPWVMKLTYATMLNGVPGTGTRDGGLSGLMLKVNLDGIVLIRFHHLCLRVSSLAVLLYVLVVLPVYRTFQCSFIGRDIDTSHCIEQNLTDYHRFTMENIPPLHNSTQYHEGIIVSFLPVHERAVLRLYTVVFVSWIVSWYTYVLLDREWRDILALRRVYFLEADHWSDRNAELEGTLLRDEREKQQGIADIESGKHYPTTRDPWIHHPEMRDTVPNIELYSVLVGGLPSLPSEVFLQEDVKAVFSRKQSIDWQLAVTSAFFDHCVPNQPGFSSSVAAVTILPAASQITKAWKHWYKTAAKVRRLRFIRQEIAKMKKEMNVHEDKNDSTRSIKWKKMHREKKTRKRRNSSVYTESEEKKKYYREVLGTTDDLNVENNFLHALNLGPEQTAVYSREFAQGAATIAPFGWNESRVRNSSLEELLEMEKDAINAVEKASKALQKAQEKIVQHGALSEELDLEDVMAAATATSTSFENGVHKQQMKGSDGITRVPDKSELSNFGQRVCNASNEKPFLGGNKSGDDDTVSASDVTANDDPVYNTASEFARTNAESKAQTATPGERMSFWTNKQLENNGTTRNLWALDALGLEAGLFLEQKNLSIGFSQHTPRYSLHRSKSAEDMLVVHGEKTAKTLFVSNQHDQPEHPKPTHRRVRSSDDVSLLQDLLAIEDSSESDTDHIELDPGLLSQDFHAGEELFSTCQPSFLMQEDEEKDKLEREKLEYEPHEPDRFPWDTEKNVISHKLSIWDKIASEQDRRSQLRERLGNLSKSCNESEPEEAKEKSSGNEIIGQFEKGSSILSSKTAHTPQHEFDLYKDDIQKDSRQRANISEKRLFAIDELNSSFDGSGSTHAINNESDAFCLVASERSLMSTTMDESMQLAYGFEEKAGLRQRQRNNSVDRLHQTSGEKWSKVIQITNECTPHRDADVDADPVLNGRYSLSSISGSIITISKKICDRSAWRKRSADIVDPFDLAGKSTFAVVTFTSRQAAVAARYCLADSRGGDRWNTVSDLPSPPLADAPVSNLSSFVRPVTISINDRQKMIRHTLAMSILVAIYIFYIIPLTKVQQLLSPGKLKGIAPDIEHWLENNMMGSYIFSGLLPTLVWTGFNGICPPMFTAIANFGSNATSAACAEGSAMRYFWWFMIVSAFTGTSLASALLESFGEGDLNLSMNFQKAMVGIASTIPTIVSATWLNWIIIRTSLVLPTQYILQMNAFLLSWLGVKSLARAVQGGGSGGPIPYRIYIDSGVVMLCLLALAPASPLIAIPAFAYFLFSVPMLRWVLIFLYKPKFDVGGARFPFIFDMCVSGMLAGQSLLGTMLLCKGATGPAVLAFLPLGPILFYRWILLNRYLRPFTDVALLQTSLLDGWDTTEGTCTSKREEFRQFLVDCHKAAYVPVCIASDKSTVITSEPAVVVPLHTDSDEDNDAMTCASAQSLQNGRNGSFYNKHEHQSPLCHPYEPHKQPGTMMRRASPGSSMNASSMSLGEWFSPKRREYQTPPQKQHRIIRNDTSNQVFPKVPILS